jgi:hypothetical protein
VCAGTGLLGSAVQAWSGPEQTESTIVSQDLTLSGVDFFLGESDGPVRKDDGLSLTLPASGVYTSPVILAPMSFTDLGCLVEGDFPPGTSLFLEVRSSPQREGNWWTDWEPIEEEDDLPGTPYGQFACELYFVPQRDGVHQRFQYRISFSAVRPEVLPEVSEVTFNFIDARDGPSTSEILSRKGLKEPVSSVEQPPVIDREEWGCPEGGASPRWPPEYARVTHVVVHHTATPNDDEDWAARVRAIWYYHANTRGWGDVGYNFLIDPLGNVYEGRAGSGDDFSADVVGGHAKNYNFGTMGIGNMGTYSSAPVPAPLQTTLEALIAWKASQRGIDPLGRSFNSYKVYDHIAGHRDVGQTTCPGAVLYSLLPTIRQNVQLRLLQQEEAIVVDELDPEFFRSDAYWHDSCGRQDHGFWTHTTTDPDLSANWGIWRPNLPIGGWYEVFAYVPSCAGDELPEYTESAHYRVYYQGGGSTVVVNQDEEQGRWVSLGTYAFFAGTTGYVYLDDIADDHWHSLWYDSMRWVLRAPSSEPPPAPTLLDPGEGDWLADRQVTFSWTIPPTATVDDIQLVVAESPDLTDRVVDITLGPVEERIVSLPSDYPALYWSVRAHNSNGYGPYAPVRRFGVDKAPPVSTIVGLYKSLTGVYFLMWRGEDAGSGVASYTLQVRYGESDPWQDLWVDVPWTSGVVEIVPGMVQYFRVHARDNLGHEEAPHGGDGDISSDQVTLLEWGWYYPLVLNQEEMVVPTRPPTSAPTPSFTPRPTDPLTPTPVTVGTQTATPPEIGPGPTGTPTPAPTVNPTMTALPATAQPTRLPSPTAVGTPGGFSDLPDLRVVALHSSQDSPFDCDRPPGVAIMIRNDGDTLAGSFYLVLEGKGVEDCRWRFDSLNPGEQVERICPTILLNTTITATVDLENLVVEADEDNNVLVAPINVLVLPTCTPEPQ